MNITSSAYEVNFIGLRSYIHRATKLTSFFTPLLSPICVRLLRQFSCMGNPFVRVPLSIPNGSRDHPEGMAQAFGPSSERVGEAFFSVCPLSLSILRFFSLIQPLYIIRSAENGGYPPTQNGDIRSLFWLFSLMALQN